MYLYTQVVLNHLQKKSVISRPAACLIDFQNYLLQLRLF